MGRGIELRPEQFGKLLRSLGFRRCGKLEPPKDAPACFRRTLYLYEKLLAEQGEGDAADEAQLAPIAAEEKPSKKRQTKEAIGTVVNDTKQIDSFEHENL